MLSAIHSESETSLGVNHDLIFGQRYIISWGHRERWGDLPSEEAVVPSGLTLRFVPSSGLCGCWSRFTPIFSKHFWPNDRPNSSITSAVKAFSALMLRNSFSSRIWIVLVNNSLSRHQDPASGSIVHVTVSRASAYNCSQCAQDQEWLVPGPVSAKYTRSKSAIWAVN